MYGSPTRAPAAAGAFPRLPLSDGGFHVECHVRHTAHVRRAGVGAPDLPQNSSFRASAGTLGTVGPGRNDIGARPDRLVAALAHRLACTLESERRRDERHCGRGRPRKARLVVQRAGAPHEGQDPRRVCLQRPPGPRAVLCRVRTCTCRVTQHACCTQNLHAHGNSSRELGRFDPHARPAEPERAQNSV